MNLSTLLKQGVLVVRIDGELDIHTAAAFRTAVDNALEQTGAQHILLNFGGVEFIDSSGLGVILGRYKRISFQGGKLLMACMQPQVLRVLELAGLPRIMGMFSSEAEAFEHV